MYVLIYALSLCRSCRSLIRISFSVPYAQKTTKKERQSNNQKIKAAHSSLSEPQFSCINY